MTQFAKIYGGALYDLAREEKLDGPLGEELAALAAGFKKEPRFVKLLSNPALPKDERCGMLQESFGGKIQPYLLNFLKILCERGELSQLSGCAAEYRARYNADHGIVEATAVTARALSAAEAQALQQRLEAQTGKTVLLHNRIDQDVLGGVRLEMEGKQLDGTVQNRLETLRKRLGTLVMQ